VKGARLAVTDAQHAVQRYVAEHLDELVAEREKAAAAKTSEFNEHLKTAVWLYAEIQQIANEITTLAALIGPMRPGDVSGSGFVRRA